MRVFLISANTETINMLVLPLGMAFVARAAEDAGHEVAQVNLTADPEWPKTLAERIPAFQPDVIGLSVRNIDDQNSQQPRFLLDSAKEIVSACRRYSGADIVLGGPGYSIFPGDALTYLEADMGIRGPGEKPFVTLLDRLEANETISDIPGLHHPVQAVANPPETMGSLDRIQFPQPGRHIVAIEPAGDDIIWLPFQSRRGCPFNCSYCSTPMIEGTVTCRHAAGRVVNALSECVAAGFDHFFFVDNTFNLPVGYSRDLCERIIRTDLDIAWRCIFYPWKMDRDLAVKMAESGCVEASLGAESGSNAMLKRMNKQFRTEDIRRASHLLKEVGIRRMGFLLLGGPGETRETVRESLEFMDSLALEMVKVTIGIRIYPGTELDFHARRTGKIPPGDNLLIPRFYIEDGMEEWIRRNVGAWMKDRPNWID